jgi:hypothetical protein
MVALLRCGGCDAVYVEPLRWLPSYKVDPVPTEVTLSLETNGYFVIDWLTYTDDATGVATLMEPDATNGWSVTVELTMNDTFCYTMSGHVVPGDSNGTYYRELSNDEFGTEIEDLEMGSGPWLDQQCIDLRKY